MARVKLHDKEFKLFIPHKEIVTSIKQVAEKINRDFKERERPLFLPVLNGSFMFAAELLQEIDFLCEISFVKLASYSGTDTTGSVNKVLGLDSSIKGRDIIVVEDIVDSGNTIEKLDQLLKEAGAKSISYCTLLYKPAAYQKELEIKYVAIEIPNDFIVGYGLDYDELGRELKDIYVLD